MESKGLSSTKALVKDEAAAAVAGVFDDEKALMTYDAIKGC